MATKPFAIETLLYESVHTLHMECQDGYSGYKYCCSKEKAKIFTAEARRRGEEEGCEDKVKT
jgi:hypothetical protein